MKEEHRLDHDFAHDVTPVELHTLNICLNWLITKLKLDWNKIGIDLSSWKNWGNQSVEDK